MHAALYAAPILLRRNNFQALPHVSAAAIGEPVAAHGAGEAPATASFWALTVGSIGVVYGDIGTSPLYAFREVGAGGGRRRRRADSEPAVLGILSLILWALIFIVTLKYVLILLRADNNGEGGTLTLMALAQRALARPRAASSCCSASSAARCSMATP